ncbi:hypothetical protein GCM10029964_027770 [Kibdelosporangium lantanae]
MLSEVREVQQRVAQAADKLGLHANAPTLTLTLLTEIGRLADDVLTATEGAAVPSAPPANGTSVWRTSSSRW